VIAPTEDLTAAGRGWREIHRYAYSARRFDDVWPLLADGGARLLGIEASSEGGGFELRVNRAGIDVPRTVRVHVGGLVHLGDRALVPLSWADFGHPRLFPVLKAVIELAPADCGGHSITQVGLLGRYRPPLGALGEAVDRMAGGEIVAESVTTFVAGLAGRFDAELASTRDSMPAAAGDHEPHGVEDRCRRVFLPVSGIHLRAGGAIAIRLCLARFPGVRTVEVDPFAAMALVSYDPQRCNLDALAACAEDAADVAAALDTFVSRQSGEKSTNNPS
jgi:hypothetical protein